MSERPKGTLINPMARHLDAIGGPIRIAHAEGVRLYDESGRSWIDCETGSGLFSLGHRDADVLQALDRALQQLDIGNHHLVSQPRARLAIEIARIISQATQVGPDPGDGPDSPENSVFNVSAAECVDCAVKLARGATSKATIISANNAFHGSTGAALAASAPQLSMRASQPLSGFIHVEYGVTAAIETALDKCKDVAAVLLEPIAVEAGIIIPPDVYLSEVFHICRDRGVLLILDDSVSGLGRTGSTCAWTYSGAEPDILIMPRSLGGGFFPIYATCHTFDLDIFYQKHPFVHISTFGGAELGCDAALCALSKLSSAALYDNVTLRGEEFRSAVSSKSSGADSPVRAVRGVGLLNAIECRDVHTATELERGLIERGVLCRRALLAPDCLLFIPPLTITSEENRAIIDALLDSIVRVTGSLQ